MLNGLNTNVIEVQRVIIAGWDSERLADDQSVGMIKLSHGL